MATLLDDADRAALQRRLGALVPDARAQWGRFDVGHMLCHVADALLMALGELPVAPRRGLLAAAARSFPLKQLVIHVLPFPRGAPTAPELLGGTPAAFAADRARVADLVERLGRGARTGMGATHPLFGPLSATDWGVLQWRHTDHHLRQFGG